MFHVFSIERKVNRFAKFKFKIIIIFCTIVYCFLRFSPTIGINTKGLRRNTNKPFPKRVKLFHIPIYVVLFYFLFLNKYVCNIKLTNV